MSQEQSQLSESKQETKEDEQQAGGSNVAKNMDEFVNTGLARWEAARDRWLAHAKKDADSPDRSAIPLQVDEVIDIIFNPRWRNQGDLEAPPPRFPQNVPLPQMVDVLVDLWEAEGLDV
eukprot:Nitzschia sp. Nitz4//scaffold5_size260463//70650//71233//NITZ4_000961-RA/size260463-augustus-gene-0.6-mRNA-1//1//CDS//3329555277//7964//frame0